MPMEFRAFSAFNLIQSANIMCTSYSCPDEHAYAHAFLFREGRQWRLFGRGRCWRASVREPPIASGGFLFR